MKTQLLKIPIAALALSCGLPLSPQARLAPAILAPGPQDEQELIRVLTSDASVADKDQACAQLKRIGTARAVPALARLLPDEELSHSARYALESMPAPEAGLALAAALDKTSGMARAGIIHSLGRRREDRAVPALSRLLGDADLEVASAAAAALGRIGGEPASQSLLDGLSRKSAGGLQNALLDGLLAAANRDLADGNRGAAFTLFEKVMAMPAGDHIRLAAYRGLIAAADRNRALELVKTAIGGGARPERMAALEMARRLNFPELTGILCESIPGADSSVKVALIEALRQRGDAAAAQSLEPMVKDQEPEVRIAALTALGELGDAAAVASLLQASASSAEREANAGRRALLVLRRGDVTRALIAQLDRGRPEARLEAAKALAGRGDKDAMAKLISVAGESPEPVRGAVFLALAQLADVTHVHALVRLVLDAAEDTALDEARRALSAVCLRLQGEGVPVDPGPILEALAGAPAKARGALLRAGSAIADERLRAATRAAFSDPHPALREAAAQALCDTGDPELLPDLLSLAAQAADPTLRVQAVRGYIRLTLDPRHDRFGTAARVAAIEQVLPLTRPEERWAVLAGLARLQDPAALEMASAMLTDPLTRTEAALAVTAIASSLAETRPQQARMALEKVLTAGAGPDQRKAAAAALRRIGAKIPAASPISFRRIQADAVFRSEGLAVADFNRDGRLDIATGNILYQGPDWKPQPMLAAAREYKPDGYSNEFLCFAKDIDCDGWLDLVVVGFPGALTRWLQNPGRRAVPWKEFPAVEKTGNESPAWADVDRDGNKELVFLSANGVAFARPGKDPMALWPIRVIASPGDPRPGHGLGVGDINGDGRDDVICPEGWWEAPAADGPTPWTFHGARLGFEAPAQMLVLDVNGDGRADVVSSGAHRYGLWWYEQTPQDWHPHEIDHSISQLHALHSADINNDGLPDLVTGKRYLAHTRGDDGIDEPAVLCWFELRRETSEAAWIRHDIDHDSGVGLHFQIIDLNGDGHLDIVTSNKKGVYAFLQEKR